MNAFISYSHEDKNYLERLHTHLANLKRDGLISTWTDEAIRVGERFDNSISDSLKDSEIFIALLSPDYIASEYCYDKEFERALQLEREGKIHIIPIVLEPCDWVNTPFYNFKVVPDDGKPISEYTNKNKGFLNVTHEIRNFLKKCANKEIKGTKKKGNAIENLTIALNEKFQFLESQVRITDILNTISEYREQNIEYKLNFRIENITEFEEEYRLLLNSDNLSDDELARKNTLKDYLNSRFYFFDKTTIYELLEYSINLIIDYSYLKNRAIYNLDSLFLSVKVLIEYWGFDGFRTNSSTTRFDVYNYAKGWSFKINVDEEEVDNLMAKFKITEKGFLVNFLGLDLFDLSNETIIKQVIPKQAYSLTQELFSERIEKTDIPNYMGTGIWRIGLA